MMKGAVHSLLSGHIRKKSIFVLNGGKLHGQTQNETMLSISTMYQNDMDQIKALEQADLPESKSNSSKWTNYKRSDPNLNYNQLQRKNTGNAAMYGQQQQRLQGQHRPNQMHSQYDNRIWKGLSWRHVINAVKHEMFPVLGSSLESCIESTTLDLQDLSEDAADRVIKALHGKRKLNTKEAANIKYLVQRAREYKANGEHRPS